MAILTNAISLLASSMLRTPISAKDIEAFMAFRELASHLPFYLQVGWVLGLAIVMICCYDHHIAMTGIQQSTSAILLPIRVLIHRAVSILVYLFLITILGFNAALGALVFWSLYSRRYFTSGFLVITLLLSATMEHASNVEENKPWSLF
jgi:hypothetical protein